MLDLLEQKKAIRYCNVCDYVLLKDFFKLADIHRQVCSIIAAGGDCMHFEADKNYCECGK